MSSTDRIASPEIAMLVTDIGVLAVAWRLALRGSSYDDARANAERLFNDKVRAICITNAKGSIANLNSAVKFAVDHIMKDMPA